MRKKFTFIYVLLAAIFTISSCDSGSGGGTGSGGSGGGGINPNSYGIDSNLEIINKAFYMYESEDGFTVYSLAFSSDKYADPNGSEQPESYFRIEFPETCLGKTIALDAERGGEEGFFLYFELGIGKTNYFYEADYIHNGFVDIEAGFEDAVNTALFLLQKSSRKVSSATRR